VVFFKSGGFNPIANYREIKSAFCCKSQISGDFGGENSAC